LEARSRLASVLDVCEHERKALDALREPRLAAVLTAMTALRAEIVAALALLEQSPSDGDISG
jgi:hypothetical protein